MFTDLDASEFSVRQPWPEDLEKISRFPVRNWEYDSMNPGLLERVKIPDCITFKQ